MDSDLLLFLRAWTGDGGGGRGEEDLGRVMERLHRDAAFRKACVEEIRLLSSCEVVQRAAPRWMALSEVLGLGESGDFGEDGREFADRVMSNLVEEEGAGERVRKGWFSWGQWSAAAAGLILGVLCTSVGWAIASPRVVATSTRLSTLGDGSFEAGAGRLPSGFPISYGSWSGDEAEVVEANEDLRRGGKRVLCFLRAEGDPGRPKSSPASCDVYQVVDLRALPAVSPQSDSILELSVEFRDARAERGEPIQFACFLTLFSGRPQDFAEGWPARQGERLVSASAGWKSEGGSPQVWKTLTTRVMVPPEADFALVHLVANNPRSGRVGPAVFGQQFADEVRLVLKTQPVLPVVEKPSGPSDTARVGRRE
ncbi:MAG: hypothetical protein RLZZ244_3021 [Verrucomicrobiota bacterium]